MVLLLQVIVPLILGAGGIVGAYRSLTPTLTPAFPPVRAAGQFVSSISLVEVYATVTDADGRFVPGLTAADFMVDEDGQPQAISTFTSGDFPLAVAVGIDRSFSMSKERLAAAVSATRGFISSLRPADRVMVLAIGSETETIAPLSNDRAAASTALERLDPWGTTPLYDATLAAIAAVEPASGRRALILISDGDDRYSQATATDTVEQARRKDVLIYPVALGRARPEIFAELAAVTGGRSFLVDDVRRLQATLSTIAQELRFQYLIGYTPARPASDRPVWRGIDVRVTRPGLRVRARDGYVAYHPGRP